MKNTISIGIGGYHASRSPSIIHTILGSCVAVCLFDPVARVGGMNHIFLPGEADPNSFNAPSRYSVNAMELLINKMMLLGAPKRRLVAKVFGGGNIIEDISKGNGVGAKIAAFVTEFLGIEGIPVVSHDLGGTFGRKIYFHTDSGEVFLKRIASLKSEQLSVEEQKILKFKRRDIEKAGEITLFNKDK